MTYSRQSRLGALAVLAAVTLHLPSTQGQEIQRYDSIPKIKTKNYIPDALRLTITPRGLEIFKTKLRSLIVTQADFDPSDISVDAFTKEFSEPIKWEDLHLPERSLRTLIQTKKFLNELLMGFALNEIRPLIQVGDSQFQARFSKFSLTADESLLKAMGKTTGAVLALDLEITEASFVSNYIKIFDLNNQQLFKKPFGVENLGLRIAGKRVPLKIRVPFYVNITKQNTLHFEAIKLDSNLNNIDLSLSIGSIFSPRIALIVEDQKYELNPNKLQQLLADNQPVFLDKIRSLLAEFAQVDLPRILNEKAQDSMVQKLEEVQPLAAPGSNKKSDRFFWGLQLAEIFQQNSFQVRLNAFAEDDPRYQHQPPHPLNNSRGSPNLAIVPAANYDVGVTVDRGLINRILQLSFERKFFEKIPIGDGYTLKLTRSPLVDFHSSLPQLIPNQKGTYLKLQISLQVPQGMITGLERTLISNHFEMSIDVLAKLKEMPYPTCGDHVDDKGFNIILRQIDLDSLKIDDKWLTFIGRAFRDTVLQRVRSRLAAMSTSWQTQELSIGGCFMPPTEVLGIKLEVNQLAMDPNGHLMIYFNYTKPDRNRLRN